MTFIKGNIPWNKGKKLGPNLKHSEKLKGRAPWNKGLKGLQKHSEETKKKIRDHHKNNPVKYWEGKKMSEETKKRMSLAKKGKYTKENSWMWNGGSSFEEYTINWTESLRIAIRERDKYICQTCNQRQGDIPFHIHHIDYNKKNCDPNNLILLCPSCHMKTNHNRQYWIKYFKKDDK